MIVNPEGAARRQNTKSSLSGMPRRTFCRSRSYRTRRSVMRVRQGMSWGDLGRAFVSASGAGFVGQDKLDEFTKRQVGKAQKDYLKAYNHYRYDNYPVSDLEDAWDTYTGKLRDLGVIH